MKNKKVEEFEKFIEFVDSDEGLSSKEAKERLNDRVKSQLLRAKSVSGKSWISEASANRKKFNEASQGLIKELKNKMGSNAEIVGAIRNGSFGAGAKQKLQVQFRNRSVNDLSDEDLLSIIGDQKLLELLKQFRGSKK